MVCICMKPECQVKMHAHFTFVPSLETIAKELRKNIHDLDRDDLELFARCMACKNAIRRKWRDCQMHPLLSALKKLKELKAEAAAEAERLRQAEIEQGKARLAAQELERLAAQQRRQQRKDEKAAYRAKVDAANQRRRERVNAPAQEACA